MTMVAGAALVIALAGVIDRAGLGSGLWLMFLAPTLAELVPNLAAIAAAYDAGEYPFSGIVYAALFTAFAVAAIVGIVLAARGAAAVSAACMWPLLIAYTVLAWLLIGIGLGDQRRQHRGGVGDHRSGQRHPPPDAGRRRHSHHLALCSLDPVSRPAEPGSGGADRRRAGGHRPGGRDAPVTASTALPLGSVQIVVATVVATTILMDWGFISGSERPVEGSSEPLSPQV